MNYALTKQHQKDKLDYAEFAERELRPKFHAMEEAGETFPAILQKMKEKRLMGIPMPEKYGGIGKDYVSAALCMEELSKIAPGVPGIINVSTEIVGVSLLNFGTEEQKQKYLVPLNRGEVIGAFALTEAGAGSDTAGVCANAVLKEDHWVLNGTKCFITNAEIADVFLIAALADIGDGTKKISMFIVEKGFPGFFIGKRENKMGMRGFSTCELILEQCIVPKENILGALGKGLKIALGGLDGGRVMIAAQGLGIAQGCWNETVTYLKSHIEESKGSINKQSVQFELAKMQVKIDAARLMVYRAASMWSQGEKFGQEAAMAKYYATDVANEMARVSIQLMGMEGCTYGNLVEQLFRDAKITEIYEGTNEIQLMVIARQLGLMV